MIGRSGQHGVMAGGMEAKDDFGAGLFFDAPPLGADGDTAIVADFEERAHAPDIIPPRTFGRGAQDGAFFFFGGVPSAERGLAQLARDFMGVMVGAPGVDGWVGFMDLRDFFTGKAGGRRPCQNGCSRSTLPLAWGVGAWRRLMS